VILGGEGVSYERGTFVVEGLFEAGLILRRVRHLLESETPIP